jgi:hypothetical protein
MIITYTISHPQTFEKKFIAKVICRLYAVDANSGTKAPSTQLVA